MSRKSVVVSATGIIGGFFDKLVTKVRVLGGDSEQFYELLVGKRSEEFIGQVADLAMKMVGRVFPVWKTITLGACDSAKTYRKALTSAGFRIGDWASDILDKIQVSAKQVKLDLVRVSVRDLGFTEATPLKQIFAKAKELGLELCPNEVGPALRLAYKDQPCGEWVYIAMEPIADSDGAFGLFEVIHDCYGRWLDGSCDGPGGLWLPGDVFVFVSSCK